MQKNPFHGSSSRLHRKPGKHLETVTVGVGWLEGTESCLHIMGEKSHAKRASCKCCEQGMEEREIKVSEDENSPGSGRPGEW